MSTRGIGAVFLSAMLLGTLTACSGNEYNPAGIVNDLLDDIEAGEGRGQDVVDQACELAGNQEHLDRAAKSKLHDLLDSAKSRYRGEDPESALQLDAIKAAVDIQGSVTDAANDGLSYACGDSSPR